MNEIGVITMSVMFALRLALPFMLLMSVGTLVQRHSALAS